MVLGPAAAPARAESGDWLNVDCDIGWQGCYRPSEWVPVDINIQAPLKEPFEGVLTVTGDQDEQSSMTVVRRFVLTPDVPLAIPMVARLAGGSAECNVTITDAKDRTIRELRYGAYDPTSGSRTRQPVGPADVLIGVIGRVDFGLRQLPQAAHTGPPGTQQPGGNPNPANSGSGDPRAGALYVREKFQPRLPWDWTAYECLDLLILYDPDWTSFTAQQSAAVAQWVTGGGRLLVVLGAHPLPAAHPIARLLPLKIGSSRKVTLPAPAVRNWNCDESEAARAVTAWPLEDVSAWGWASQDYGTGDPIFAHGPVGFGRAAVLAFDPSVLRPRAGPAPAAFWISLTGPLMTRNELVAGVTKDDASRGYNNYSPPDPASQSAGESVLNFLLDIPQMRPISIIWIILLLLGLAAVIGPVDYFVLKRFDRLPLTWLTFTFYIVAFSVVAFYGVKALKSGQAQLRAVTVVDAVQGSYGQSGAAGQGAAWSTCYSGIFAPESDDYRLSGLARGQWWSSFSPYSQDYGYYNERRATRRMTCTQEDGSSLPSYLPINIWSMQCLLSESAAAEMPIAVTVDRDGDTVRATVENLTDMPVASLWFQIAGGRKLVVGKLDPKGKKQIASNGFTNTGWPEGPAYVKGACGARGTTKRTQAMEQALEKGAVLVCAEFADSPPGFGLADRSFQTTHSTLARLLVTPDQFRKGGAP